MPSKQEITEKLSAILQEHHAIIIPESEDWTVYKPLIVRCHAHNTEQPVYYYNAIRSKYHPIRCCKNEEKEKNKLVKPSKFEKLSEQLKEKWGDDYTYIGLENVKNTSDYIVTVCHTHGKEHVRRVQACLRNRPICCREHSKNGENPRWYGAEYWNEQIDLMNNGRYTIDNADENSWIGEIKSSSKLKVTCHEHETTSVISVQRFLSGQIPRCCKLDHKVTRPRPDVPVKASERSWNDWLEVFDWLHENSFENFTVDDGRGYHGQNTFVTATCKKCGGKQTRMAKLWANGYIGGGKLYKCTSCESNRSNK